MALHTAIGQPLANFIDNLNEDAWYAFMAMFGFTISETDLAFYKDRIAQRVDNEIKEHPEIRPAVVALEILQELGLL